MKCSGAAFGLIGLLLFGLTIKAQNTPGGETKEILSTGGLRSALLAAPVLGQPYSAVVQHETIQKLANGTMITHKGHHFIARDSEGRVHVEVRLVQGSHGQQDTVMVFVVDPVAHKLTTWVAGTKVNSRTASEVKIPRQRRKLMREQPENAPTRPQPIITAENLGMETLQGIPVSVVKTTTIVPAGRSGNDAPITKFYETWTSSDLKLVMKQQWEDPRSPERTVELQDLSRTEPNPALFRVPADYTVKAMSESLKELEEKLSEIQNEN